MNFKLIFNKIGNILQIEGVLMLIPLIIGLIYKENFYNTILVFLICPKLGCTICPFIF